MTDPKQGVLKHLSAAIAALQDAINELEKVHPIARDTDVYKKLTLERNNLRVILVEANRLKLS